MKTKRLFLLSVLALLFTLQFNQQASAQTTTVANITVVNNGLCDAIANSWGYEAGCTVGCSTGLVIVPAGGSATFQNVCIGVDGVTSVAVGIRDMSSGQGAAVGNACGITPTGTYSDCNGNDRTVTYVNPSLVLIN